MKSTAVERSPMKMIAKTVYANIILVSSPKHGRRAAKMNINRQPSSMNMM